MLFLEGPVVEENRPHQTLDTDSALRERIKELTCLYGIAKVAERADRSLREVLQQIVALLPPSWQYPEIAAAGICLDGEIFKTDRFIDNAGACQTVDIVVDGRTRGWVQVGYLRAPTSQGVDPFLKEEVYLIHEVARQVAEVVGRREAEEAKRQLQSQLMHADRLATIGQLAAGVAHELNEPINGVLGFAQLAKKSPGLPAQTKGDLAKIEAAALHARSVMQKLVAFARPAFPHKAPVNLNEVIHKAQAFCGARCTEHGIRFSTALEPDMPDIVADAGQLYQVLVNLAVNAVQAMPDGGELSIRTLAGTDTASLTVEDNGVGMDKDTSRRIFEPFFTTKDVDQGTGLGLSIVQSIVSSHGGDIKVHTEQGRGSRFEIAFPIGGPAAGEAGLKPESNGQEGR